jgi:hypothetical protein
MADLASLQQWLQQTILAGGADSLAPVRQSNRLPAATRLSVYVNGHRLRLIECLQKEFPMLRRLLGEQPFDLLARAYVELNPSHSYTLYAFGAGFAAYLEARQPPGLGDIAGMPAALARIERAKVEVFRARGHKAEPPPDEPFLHSLVAEPPLPRRPQTVRLLALPYDFRQTLAADARGEPLPLPDVADCYLAVARVGYRVECHPLERWQYDWLAALPDADDPQPPPIPGGDDRLRGWLPEAAARGLVIAVP